MADSRLSAMVNEAWHHMVRSFGVDNIEKVTAQSAGVIYNKTSITSVDDHNKITLGDAVIWTMVTRNFAGIQATCNELGGVFVQVGHLAHVSDSALLELMLKAEKERGDFADLLAISLANGCITPEAMEKLTRESYEAIGAQLTLLHRLQGLRCV